MRFLGKVITVILSTLLFSLCLAFFEYIPLEERQVNVGYFSFNELFMIYVYYSFFIYLIGGVYSYFVDLYFEKNQFYNKLLKYMVSFLAYVAGGILIVGLLLIIILLIDGNSPPLLISKFFILGVSASLLFFHVSLVLNKIFSRYKLI